MRIEQHLMRLQQISPNQKGAAVRQLDMRDLQLDALSAHIGPILAPVELERLTWCKHQRHESSPIRRVIRALPFAFPFPNEGGNALVGAVISSFTRSACISFAVRRSLRDLR